MEAGAGTRPASRGGEEGQGEGGAGREREMAVPSWRIGVKTDVVVETSERLVYNDRLY